MSGKQLLKLDVLSVLNSDSNMRLWNSYSMLMQKATHKVKMKVKATFEHVHLRVKFTDEHKQNSLLIQ